MDSNKRFYLYIVFLVLYHSNKMVVDRILSRCQLYFVGSLPAVTGQVCLFIWSVMVKSGPDFSSLPGRHRSLCSCHINKCHPSSNGQLIHLALAQNARTYLTSVEYNESCRLTFSPLDLCSFDYRQILLLSQF